MEQYYTTVMNISAIMDAICLKNNEGINGKWLFGFISAFIHLAIFLIIHFSLFNKYFSSAFYSSGSVSHRLVTSKLHTWFKLQKVHILRTIAIETKLTLLTTPQFLISSHGQLVFNYSVISFESRGIQ